jgi:transposase, IS5 family
MGQPRYRETGDNSFYANYLYDQIVAKGHFLRQLDAVIPWQEYGAQLLKCYKGAGEYGRPPWEPVLMLKVLLLAQLYDLSRRDTEAYLNENIPAKWFIGLAIDKPAPDYSTIADFQSRLVKNRKAEVFKKLLDDLIFLAKSKGVVFGSIQIVDSVHVIADVNTQKDDHRDKEGKPRRDPAAQWGVKHKRTVRDEEGNEKKIPEYFFGYKQHTSMNAQSGLITSLTHTSGEAYDGHQLPRLIEHDSSLGLPISIVTADKGYDDGNNHYFLELHKLHSAIRLYDIRTAVTNQHRDIWLALKRTSEYKAGLEQRGRIEAKFGEAKTRHGLRRCRDIGMLAFQAQSYLTAIAMNMKRIVLLLTGVAFGHSLPARVKA